jgi:hypothetical protein
VQILFHSEVHPYSIFQDAKAYFESDLLVRHERLTHHKEHMNDRSALLPTDATHTHPDSRPYKRRRSSEYSGIFEADISSPQPYPHILPTQYQPAMAFGDMCFGQSDEFSLAALSMAAEYQSLQGDSNQLTSSQETRNLTSLPVRQTVDERTLMQYTPHNQTQRSRFESSLENLTTFLENQPFRSFHFTSRLSVEQPMPLISSSESGSSWASFPNDLATNFFSQGHRPTEEPRAILHFRSRFPSLQPGVPERNGIRHSIPDISNECRDVLVEKISEFSSIVPSDFKLPTRLALRRYFAAYVNSFHEQLPFLHIPSMSVETCSVELVLALAAVGAHYTFECENGIQLFNVSQMIATHRIRRSDSRSAEQEHRSELGSSSPTEQTDAPSAYSQRGPSAAIGPLGVPPEADALGEDLMQTAQALLLLMAMSTWAKHKDVLREALAIQSILATLIRDDGLELSPLCEDISWTDWIRRETIKRTKFIVYGFSNLHCIVHNVPPLLLTSEVSLPLPCSAAEFIAPTEAQWKEARKKSPPELPFQDALKRLFSKHGQTVTETTSSPGNDALIHALIQHIFFLRQVSRNRFDSSSSLSPTDTSSLELALDNWQTGWRQHPDSSLSPTHPSGPAAFNCTALLRLAYLRLYLDTAPRALDTRDPAQIAAAFHAGPRVARSRNVTRAALHAAHALSIPIKLGYRLLAKTRSFACSIQHALCSLECAYLMSKWLEALADPAAAAAGPATEDEARIVRAVKNMLDETEFAVPGDVVAGSSEYIRCLNAGVLRVWAVVLKGEQMCAVVDVIGRALGLYADMLEAA